MPKIALIHGSIEINYDSERDPGRRCAEAVVKAMREPHDAAAKGYLGAARWFALAADSAKRVDT